MTTDIASNIPGRAITTYDLLEEIQETHGLDRRAAHDAIHAMLSDITSADGDEVILDRQPMRPELLVNNPGDVDIYYWLTISDDTADAIREAIAATMDT